MLVPAMTLTDIRKEIEKDFPILHRKSGYITQKLSRLYSDSLREKKVTRFFDYQSKYKNKWIYKIELSKKKTNVTFLTYYYGKKGLTAIEPMSGNTLLYFTAHFFNRYNERRKLNLTMPNDIMQAFLNDNMNFNFQRLEEFRPGVFKIFGVTQSGVVLGIYHVKLNFYKLNTFITSDMLKSGQTEMEQQLKDALNLSKMLSDCVD